MGGFAVADPGVPRGACLPPGPVKISHKKMAAKGGRIVFMFLGPPYPATGSATGLKTNVGMNASDIIMP